MAAVPLPQYEKSRPATKWYMRIGVAVAGEVELFDSRYGIATYRNKKAAALMLVRGWYRGNNANNTNLSPLYVNANNAPSNANTNIGFGT